jgi:mannose-6-phosphate isomerase
MNGESFHALFVSEGEAAIEWDDGRETAKAGESVLVPAGLPAYTLAGNATVLRASIPAATAL